MMDQAFRSGDQGYGQVLRDHAIRPKKRLGQHFMIDPKLLRSVASMMVSPEMRSPVCLEIGSGIGTLTRELCAVAHKVYAVEMDRSLAGAKEEVTAGLPNLVWQWGDALDCDLQGKDLREEHPDADLVLSGNLPYYITSQVLYSALVPRSSWSRLSFVVQEELGQRMAAGTSGGNFGRLSLWCQYRADVAIVKRLSPGVFLPRPDVNSCLVVLDMKGEYPLSESAEALLDAVSRATFGKRRKTIANGLLAVLPDRAALLDRLSACGIDPSLRPETLGVEGFVKIVGALDTD